MKVSIITPSFNSEKTIEETIKSVLGQTYKDIEYIIIDGKSKDRTVEIINKYKDKISKIVSKPDKGIYDAMNKGIKIANSEIIGVLNSDDLYADEKVVEEVVKTFKKYGVDCVWGDLVYFLDDPNKIIRVWKSSDYKEGLFEKGWVPPHPTFFVKKECYEKYGYFRLDLPVAADYEIMFRFLKKYKIKGKYIPKVLVKMRAGGNANKLKNVIKGNLECIRSWEENGFKMPFYTPIFRFLRRIPQILRI